MLDEKLSYFFLKFWNFYVTSRKWKWRISSEPGGPGRSCCSPGEPGRSCWWPPGGPAVNGGPVPASPHPSPSRQSAGPSGWSSPSASRRSAWRQTAGKTRTYIKNLSSLSKVVYDLEFDIVKAKLFCSLPMLHVYLGIMVSKDKYCLRYKAVKRSCFYEATIDSWRYFEDKIQWILTCEGGFPC